MDLDVVHRRKDFVAVVLRVEFRLLTSFQLHGERVENVDEEPLDLQHGHALARTQGPEADEGSLQLLAVLVKLGVNEPVVFESLQNTTEKISLVT